MAKLKWKDIEIEADTTLDVIILLDKLVTYQKIREVETDALVYCSTCKSFDLDMISPTQVECQLCGSVMEAFIDDDEMCIEVILEEDEEETDEN